MQVRWRTPGVRRTVTTILLITLFASWTTAAFFPSPAHAVAPTLAQACAELVTNGGFETTAGWQLGASKVPPQYVTSPVHSGARCPAAGHSRRSQHRELLVRPPDREHPGRCGAGNPVVLVLRDGRLAPRRRLHGTGAAERGRLGDPGQAVAGARRQPALESDCLRPDRVAGPDHPALFQRLQRRQGREGRDVPRRRLAHHLPADRNPRHANADCHPHRHADDGPRDRHRQRNRDADCANAHANAWLHRARAQRLI